MTEVAVPDEERLWARRMRVLSARNAGATFDQIAKQFEISAATARKDDRLARMEILKETPEDMIARQKAVCADVLRANYAAMLKRDKDATLHVFKAMEREARLFGLDAPTRVNVGVSDVEFAEQLVSLFQELNDFGVNPAKELNRHVGTADANVIEGEVVDAVEPPAADAVLEPEPAADVTPRRPPGWSNL